MMIDEDGDADEGLAVAQQLGEERRIAQARFSRGSSST